MTQNEQAHKPGPWHVDGMLVMDAASRTIAVVKHARDEKPIAALPDMLEALEQAHRYFVGRAQHGTNREMCDLLHGVIAKAKGETS